MKRTPLTRTTRLKPRSAKRARLYATERRPLVAQLLADQPPCQRCLSAPACDVHEIQTRARGGSLTDRENLALLCRTCHTWVTEHPMQATEEGLMRPSWHPRG